MSVQQSRIHREILNLLRQSASVSMQMLQKFSELEIEREKSQEERERRADSEPERFLTLRQVAEYLAISEEKARVLVNQGVIPGGRVGDGSIRVPISGYNAWARSLTPALLNELGLPEDRFEHLEVAA